jgi:hypothetical protein
LSVDLRKKGKDCTKRYNASSQHFCASLVGTIKEMMGNLDTDTVAKACRRFHSRMEAVVEANGDFLK